MREANKWVAKAVVLSLHAYVDFLIAFQVVCTEAVVKKQRCLLATVILGINL